MRNYYYQHLVNLSTMIYVTEAASQSHRTDSKQGNELEMNRSSGSAYYLSVLCTVERYSSLMLQYSTLLAITLPFMYITCKINFFTIIGTKHRIMTTLRSIKRIITSIMK